MHGLEADLRGERDALRGSDHEVAPGTERAGEALVHLVARLVREVDDDVAAEDQVETLLVAVAEEVSGAEAAQAGDLGRRLVAVVLGAEEAGEGRAGHAADVLL